MIIKKYKKKYKSIIMEPTKEYITEMFPWKPDKKHLSILTKGKCNKKLINIPYSFNLQSIF